MKRTPLTPREFLEKRRTDLENDAIFLINHAINETMQTPQSLGVVNETWLQKQMIGFGHKVEEVKKLEWVNVIAFFIVEGWEIKPSDSSKGPGDRTWLIRIPGTEVLRPQI